MTKKKGDIQLLQLYKLILFNFLSCCWNSNNHVKATVADKNQLEDVNVRPKQNTKIHLLFFFGEGSLFSDLVCCFFLINVILKHIKQFPKYLQSIFNMYVWVCAGIFKHVVYTYIQKHIIYKNLTREATFTFSWSLPSSSWSFVCLFVWSQEI